MYEFSVSTEIKAKALVRNSIFLKNTKRKKKASDRERNELVFETIKPAEKTSEKPNSMA